MTVNGRFIDIRRPGIDAVADRYGMRLLVHSTIHKVKSALDRWTEFAAIANVDAKKASEIQSDFNTAPEISLRKH